MEPKRDLNERNKKPISKDKFDWKTFDMDKFFKDAEKVGEIIRQRDLPADAD